MMAGDWMKIDLELPDKPEVHYIASLLKLEPASVVGHLVKVWGWFDKHTTDGHAQGVTFAVLDRMTVPGFGEAMQFAGWLNQRGTEIFMPKFDRHTSESAKKRALAQKRKSRQRHVVSVTQTGPEKRREEKKDLLGLSSASTRIPEVKTFIKTSLSETQEVEARGRAAAQEAMRIAAERAR